MGETKTPLFGLFAEDSKPLIATVLGVRLSIQEKSIDSRAHGGSFHGRSPNGNIGRESAEEILNQSYF